jgi:NAD(P)-dependent dehydrogenase (short-subunit alcohol dehydrogenase family)
MSTERRRMRPPAEPPVPSRLPRGGSDRLLDGKVAVVTGAAAGIGAGIARALAFHGAHTVLVDNDEPTARATAADIRAMRAPGPQVIVTDVTDDGAPAQVRAAAADLGGADILVNNVGDYRPAGPFVDSTEDVWERMYALNFRHVLRLTHALLPGMVQRRSGSILNVSSVEGMRGIPGNAVYGAMKAAVIAFTASLAAEVGQYGIRVNAIAPDLTDTPQTPMWASTDERYADHVGKWVPAGRFGSPRDHGDAAVFLVSEQSAFITGETLRVDGGTLAAPGWYRRDQTRFTNLPRPLG